MIKHPWSNWAAQGPARLLRAFHSFRRPSPGGSTRHSRSSLVLPFTFSPLAFFSGFLPSVASFRFLQLDLLYNFLRLPGPHFSSACFWSSRYLSLRSSCILVPQNLHILLLLTLELSFPFIYAFVHFLTPLSPLSLSPFLFSPSRQSISSHIDTPSGNGLPPPLPRCQHRPWQLFNLLYLLGATKWHAITVAHFYRRACWRSRVRMNVFRASGVASLVNCGMEVLVALLTFRFVLYCCWFLIVHHWWIWVVQYSSVSIKEFWRFISRLSVIEKTCVLTRLISCRRSPGRGVSCVKKILWYPRRRRSSKPTACGCCCPGASTRVLQWMDGLKCKLKLFCSTPIIGQFIESSHK